MLSLDGNSGTVSRSKLFPRKAHTLSEASKQRPLMVLICEQEGRGMWMDGLVSESAGLFVLGSGQGRALTTGTKGTRKQPRDGSCR